MSSTIETFGSTRLVEDASLYFLYPSGGSAVELMYGGSPVVAGQFGQWAPIGAEQTASGYEVAWKVAGADQYTVWTTDSNGNYVSNLGTVSGTSAALQSIETSFQQDLNGDGTIGPAEPSGPTVVESFGSTSLTEIGTHFYLYGSDGTGPSLKYQGADYVAGQFGQIAPIGAEQTASGYEVAWKLPGADQYSVWVTDNNGNYLSNTLTSVSGVSAALQSIETSFHQDLNGDGTIGPAEPSGPTVVESFGSTSLTEIGTHFYLYGSDGTGPSLKYQGADYVAGQFGQIAPIGAEQTASGYEVAWKLPGADQYSVWVTDNNGNYLSNTLTSVSGVSAALKSIETSFHQDLNGDGTIGPAEPSGPTVVESFGSTSLTEIGTHFYLYGSDGTGPSLKYQGADYVAGQFGQIAPIGAEQTASGYEVAWKLPGADQYSVWVTDNNGNYLSNTLTSVSGASAALQSIETSFQQDLNGDGSIGPAGAISSPHFFYRGLDSSGAQFYDVTWGTLGSHPFAVRVLTPDHPSSNFQHSFLYALPVEGGLAQSTWGDGLDQLHQLDVQNQYNATIIEPIFPIAPWYADNVTDATMNFETFMATLLPTWVDSSFSTSGTEKDLLIGFSKSGYGALDLLFKHPSVFDAVAAWDFPADMASFTEFGADSNYGTDANFQNNYRMTGSFIDTWKAPFTTQDRIWISGYNVFQNQVLDFDNLLTSHGVLHTFSQTFDAHSWFGGWLPDAVAGLYGLVDGDGTMNTPPTAFPDTADATEKGGVNNGTAGSPAGGNVLTNDTDPDAGDTKTVTAVSFGAVAGTLGTALAGAHGSLMLNASGAFAYTVNETDTAVQALRQSTDTLLDVFSYIMRDTAGATSSTSLTVTIHGANDAPTSTPVSLAAIAEDSGARQITQAQLLANATDVDGPSPTAINLAISSGNGTLVNNGNGTWSYTPALNDDTSVSFSYAVTDGVAAPVATSATLDITPVNDAPTSTPVSLAAIAEDSGARLITQAELLANATDIDGPSLTAINLAISSGNGTLVNNGNGTWSYTPAANDDTSVSFSYAVTDGVAAPVATTATLDITPVNDAPVTTPVTLAAIAEDSGARLITQAQLLANATDVDGPSLTAINLAISSGNGTLVNNGNGTWSYTPALNDDTSVSFSYAVTDGVAAPVATSATLDITPVNDAPTSTPVSLAAIAEDSGARLITQAQLLANATDVDGPSLTAINLAISSGNGTLVNNGNGTWSYTPAANDDTSVSFSYAVTDGVAAPVTTTATLDITPANETNIPPVTTPVILTPIAEDSGARLITQAQLLANATDVDGPSLTAINLTISSGNGTLVNDGNGTWSYTPALNDDTLVSFSYAVSDGVAAPVATSATLDITPVNDAPTSTPVSLAAIAEDSGARLITQAQLLANATDVDGPSLTAINLAISSGNGTLVNNGNGTWSYTPAANDDTSVSFSYAVSDGVAAPVATSATLDITPVNDAPTISNLAVSATSISFVASDPDNATLSLASPFASAFGNPLITSGATTSLTPSAQTTAVSGTLQVTDGSATAEVVGFYLGTGGSNTATAPNPTAPNAMYGFGGSDTLTGGAAADSIFGGAGADALSGAAGNDTFYLANGDFASGESIDGGADADAIVLTNPTTVNFATGTISSVETLTGSSGNDTVTMSTNQWAGFSTINLGSGTNVLNVVASGNISAQPTPTVSNVTTGNLTGTSGNDTMTLTGAQLDAIIIGAGTINLGAGTDTINLTSTSADLNTLGGTNNSIQGVEAISAAGAGGVTITLSGQTEGFTVTGSSGADTITGGSGNDNISGDAGADVITGGAGVDTLSGGAGNDTFNLANFAAGESIDGGADADAIVLTNATTVNFTTGTISNVETLTGSSGNDTVTMSTNQWTGFSTINLGSGTNVLNVVASGDISAQPTPTVSNVTTGNLTGTSGNETLTGAQLDAIIIGAGTINLGAGTDTINLTLTSADLNTLGATNASIQGVEAISAVTAGSGVTITLSGQTEGFTITGSANNDTITGGRGADTITGGDGVDRFVFNSASSPGTVGGSGDAGTFAGYDVITDFSANAGGDILDMPNVNVRANEIVNGTNSVLTIGGQTIKSHQINNGIITLSNNDTFSSGTTFSLTSLANVAAAVDYIHRNDFATNTGANIGFVANIGGTPHTYIFNQVGNNGNTTNDILVDLVGVSLTTLSGAKLAPAGVAGEAINLGLTNPTDHLGSITVNISGVPSGWTMSEGTDNGDGTWSVQTYDVSALSITAPADYAGAVSLQMSQTWTDATGGTGLAMINNNVEAYASGAPIFAISGDDNLSGSGANDVFVLAQPIGSDTIHGFDFAHDKVDLIGFSGLSSFFDVQTSLSENSNGDAVITIAEGGSITFDSVSAASLTADDFVFNLDTVMNNANSIVIGDNAVLPLAGTVNNSGTIELGSIGSQTRLLVLANGLTLEGGGHVNFSDGNGNIVVGTTPDATLTNVDNTISGAGQLGEGQLTLHNKGTIIASGSNALIIDTGANGVVNSGTLGATGSGGLVIHGDIANSGLLWANGGSITIDGNVSGTGSALIDGVATFEMGGVFGENITLGAGARATLKIDHAADFSGTVAGLDGDDVLDLADLAFGGNTTLGYTANSNNTGGTLTASDGTHTANIELLGQYMASSFAMSADGIGGTLIHDLPPATLTHALTQPQHA